MVEASSEELSWFGKDFFMVSTSSLQILLFFTVDVYILTCSQLCESWPILGWLAWWLLWGKVLFPQHLILNMIYRKFKMMRTDS